MRLQYAGETDIVANVFVKNVTMQHAQNGARIKVFGGSPYASMSAVWPLAVFIVLGLILCRSDSTAGGGSGYVRNITFEDFYGASPYLRNRCD